MNNLPATKGLLENCTFDLLDATNECIKNQLAREELKTVETLRKIANATRSIITLIDTI